MSKAKNALLLQLMAMMHEPSEKAILSQLEQWFGQPSRGVCVKRMSNEVKIEVQTGANPKMKITHPFQLFTLDDAKPIYEKGPFVKMDGVLEIDFHQQTATISAVLK